MLSNMADKQTILSTSLLVLCVFISGSVSKTVYMDDHCNEQILIHGANKFTVANWTSLLERGTCSVNVTAQGDFGVTGNRLMITVLDLHTQGAGSGRTLDDGQPCPEIRLDIMDIVTGTTITPAGGLCGDHLPHKHFSSGDYKVRIVLTSNLTSNEILLNETSFKLLAVRFHENPCDDGKEFECDNNRCIASSLKCNGDDDCGDDSDETDGCLLSTPVIIVIAVICSVLVISVVAMGIIMFKRSGDRRTWWGEARLMAGTASINEDRSDTRRSLRQSRRGDREPSYGSTKAEAD